MDDLNRFFKILFSSPAMLWKAGVGVIFFGLGLGVIFMPGLSLGLVPSSRYAFAGLMLLYSLFRFYGVYAEYKSYRDE